MLRRKITEQLNDWATHKDEKCLVVQGAKQAGKTYAVKQFAKERYKELVEINFKQMPSAKEIFAKELTVDAMLLAMRFRFPDKKILPEKTLIFLDEIQECREAITSLKSWAIDNRYDVIASGSLLGVKETGAFAELTGYVDYVKVQGMDFEEFLWAMGLSSDVVASVKHYLDQKMHVPMPLHQRMISYYRLFIATGGMPEAVAKFMENRDFREVDAVQRKLLQGYQYGIAHYAHTEEKSKAEKCYMTLARQLLDNANHKFQYKEIEKGARAQKYYASIEWLVRADMIQLCRLVTEVASDLDAHARDNFFRAYPTDLSLLMAMSDFSLKQHIVEDTLPADTKAGVYDCAVADALMKRGYPLYFYKNETRKLELDFVIRQNGRPVPIDIKSKRSKARPLLDLLKKEGVTCGYKFIEGNICVSEEGIITLPFYMASFL